MYYNTPNMTSYLRFIKQKRKYVIAFYAILAIVSLFFFKPVFISSDGLLWLDESKEYSRTLSQNFSAGYVSRLTLTPSNLNEETKSQLISLHTKLQNHPNITYVDSLFSKSYIYNQTDGNDSSLVNARTISKLSVHEVQKLINTKDSNYSPYVNPNFSQFTFFIYSTSPINITDFAIPFDYSFHSNDDLPIEPNKLLAYMFLGMMIISLLFRLLFKNYVSVLAALLTITLTLIGTFTLMWLITGISTIYIVLILLVAGISMIDYLYFYYRWHVSHYQANNDRALMKLMNRNITPALWTTIITVSGIGSLFFIDSAIVRLLSISIILASVFTHILNITFLPALLSYFNVIHPKIEFVRYIHLFAKNEIHYNKSFLLSFLSVSSLIALLGGYYLFSKPDKLFDDHTHQHIIVAKIPYETIDLNLVNSMRDLENNLTKTFTGIEQIQSLSSVLSLLNTANTGVEVCNEQNLMQALFFLELYNMEEDYFDDNAINFTIYLNNADKLSIIQWLKKYEPLPIYFTDYNSLISSAKSEKMTTLALSIISVLVIIGLIMGRVFRQPHLVWVGFLANAIPIIWFGVFIEIFQISWSLEVLIAMTLSVGLSSNATIHFAYKYFRSRYFGRTQRHSLEVMFFYGGVPLIIGSILLAFIFALLTLIPILSLHLIGGFAAILILLSLLTDLFILPVLLLAIDPFKH